MKLRELRLSTRITISALIIVAVGSAALAFIENARIRETYISDLRASLKSDLETEKLRLNQTVETLRQDVLFLSNAPPVSGIVRAALNRGYDPRYGNTHKVWVERLEQIFTAFSHAHPNYYRIRYIGIAEGGRELVSVGNRNKMFEVSSSDKLQTKADLGYFKTTLNLQKNQIRLSEIYFEQERWGAERTTRSILRASSPVYTPSGDIFGMVVINMDMNSLLNFATGNLPAGVQGYMADMTGQYLLHPNSLNTFASRVASRGEITADFPFVETALNLQSPDFLPLQNVETSSGNALSCAMRIHFDPSDQSRFMLLLHSIPMDIAEKQIATIPIQQIGGGLIAMLLASGIAMLVLRRIFAPLEQIAYAADQIATGKHDVRLPQSGSGEIGSLSRALNAMLTQLSQREKLLLESEAKYRRLHESMMDAYVMTDMSGRLLDSNRAYQEMLGYSAEELRHLTYVDLTPENWHELDERILNEQIIPYGQSQAYEKEYVRKGGTVFPVELRTFLLRDKNNQPEAMWAIVRDITARKQAETELHRLNRALRLLSDCDTALVHAAEEGRLLAEICKLIVETGGYHMAWVGIAEHDQEKNVRPVAQYGFEEGYLNSANISWADSERGRGPIGIAIRTGVTQINQNFLNNPLLVLWREAALARGYQSSIALPLKSKAQTFAVLTIYSAALDSFNIDEVALLEELADNMASGILALRLRIEHDQTVEKLRKSSDEIEDLYNHAPCGYHSLDKDGIIRQINDTELAWLGYKREEVMWKMKWPDLLSPASQKVFRETFPQLMRQGFIRDIEAEIIRKDGTTFTGLLNASAIYDSAGNFIMSRSTSIDITERKRVERQMQELSAHLQTIREEEKHRIAREIHDDLGGTLTALKIEAYRLTSELTANQAATQTLKRINSMSTLLDSAVGVTRRIITDLRPTVLDDLGLLAALEWQAEQFQKRTGISCRVNCVEDKGELGKQYSIALFRIFQETLTNVARHSGASRVEVEFHCDGEEVSLSISDNGSGLPEGHTIAPTSYGMRGMSERVEQLGGKISFNRPQGGGFNVTVVLPLPVENIIEEKS